MPALDELRIAATKHGALTAGSQATVDLGVDCAAVRLINRGGSGADDFYALVDPGATNVTVGADGTVVVPVNGWVVVRSSGAGSTVVKMKSDGTPKWSLEGLQP